MKKIFIIIILLFVVSCSKTSENIEVVKYGSADYPGFDNTSDLTSKADIIIKGEVLSSEIREIDVADPEPVKIVQDNGKLKTFTPGINDPIENMPPLEYVFTVSKIKVVKVIKGHLKKSDIIEVKQLGGIYKNKKHVWEDVEYLSKKKKYILFLNDFNDENMPYSLVNPTQACAEISENKIKPQKNNEAIEKNITEKDFVNKLEKIK